MYLVKIQMTTPHLFVDKLYFSTFLSLSFSLLILAIVLLINGYFPSHFNRFEIARVRTTETSYDGRKEYLYLESLRDSKIKMPKLSVLISERNQFLERTFVKLFIQKGFWGWDIVVDFEKQVIE